MIALKIIVILAVFAISIPIAYWVHKAIEKNIDEYHQMQQDIKDIKKRLESEDQKDD